MKQRKRSLSQSQSQSQKMHSGWREVGKPEWKFPNMIVGVIDRGGDGDCLFHVLAASLSHFTRQHISMQDIRDVMSDSIDQNNIDLLMEKLVEDEIHYRHPRSIQISRILRNPNKILIMKKIIRMKGWLFQGNDTVLWFLLKYVPLFNLNRIGFVVFSDHGPSHTQLITNDDSSVLLLLFNISRISHWVQSMICTGGDCFQVIKVADWAELKKVLGK